MKAKKKNEFSAQLYIESIYQLCDQMKDAIKKGRIEAAAPELVILDQFMVNIDDFLDNYCYADRSE